MSLYFEYRVNVGDLNAHCTSLSWHSQQPLLAVATFSQDRGGVVYICDELGDKLSDIEPVVIPSSQVTVLCWHPSRRTLVTGWDNGDMYTWTGDGDYIQIPRSSNGSLKGACWSSQGARFLTFDDKGEIEGWRLDSRGMLVSLYKVRLEMGLPSLVCARKGGPASPGEDLLGLARKAVAGDENALDMFSSWRPKTAGRHTTTTVQHDSSSFYLSSDSGSVFYVNEAGTMREMLPTLGVIQHLLYHDRENYLLIVTEGLNMNYYSVQADGSLEEVTRVKLSGSGNSDIPSVVWAGTGLIATTVSESTVIIWDPVHGDTCSVSLTPNDFASPKEIITSLAYSKFKGLLGVIAMARPGDSRPLFWLRAGYNYEMVWGMLNRYKNEKRHIVSPS